MPGNAATASTAPGIPGAAPVQALPNNGGSNPLLVTSAASRAQTAASTAKLQSLTQPNSAQNTQATGTTPTTTTTAPTPASPAASATAAPTPNPSADTNYMLQPGETIDQYNARIATYNTAKDTAPTATTDPAAAQNSTGTSTTGTDASDPYAAAVSGISDPTVAAQYKSSLQALDQSATTAQANITSLQNATYQNDPATQAMIASITAKYTQQIQLMQAQNAQVIGRANSAVGSFGGLGVMSQTFLSDEQSQATQRVQNLQNEEQNLILQAQTAFQTNNTKALNDAMTQYDTINQQKLAALNDLNTATDNQIAQQQKQQELDETKSKDDQTLQLQQMMDNQTISYQNKQQALAQSTLDEKTKNDLATRAIAAETAEKGTYQVKTNPDGTTSIFNTATGQMVGGGTVSSGGTVAADPTKPLLSTSGENASLNSQFPEVNSAFTTSSYGVPYIDTSNLSAAGKLQAAEVAQQYQQETGNPLPMVTAKNATTIQGIDDAKSNLDDMTEIITSNNLASSNFASKPFNSALIAAEGATQANSDVAGLTSYALSAIGLARTLGAQGRLNQTEISLASKSLPEPTDTVATVQTKLKNLSNILGNAQKSILGVQAFEAANPSPASSAVSSFLQSSSPNSSSTSVNWATIDTQFGLTPQ